MTEPAYGISRTFSGIGLEEAEAQITARLKTQGFGIITRIDVTATILEKLGETIRPYRILGACNPTFAHQSLQLEPGVGLLLPCNVIVREKEDGAIEVSAINPDELFKVVGRPDMASLAAEVTRRLRAAIDTP